MEARLLCLEKTGEAGPVLQWWKVTNGEGVAIPCPIVPADPAESTLITLGNEYNSVIKFMTGVLEQDSFLGHDGWSRWQLHQIGPFIRDNSPEGVSTLLVKAIIVRNKEETPGPSDMIASVSLEN